MNEANLSETGPPDPAQDDSRRGRRVRTLNALQRALQRADAGVLARLRRVDTKSPPPDFFRISVDILDGLLPKKGAGRDAAEGRWAVLVQAIATALGTSPETGGLLGEVPFGEALAHAGVAERRVLRLLEADDDHLVDLVRHVVHQLVSKGQSFSPDSLAALVLDRAAGPRERARRQIARDFYRHHDGN